MNKHIITAMAVVGMLCLPATAKAQQAISLEQAQQMAVQNYPSIRAAHLNAKSQQMLTKSAFDLGETEVSTGGEEIGKGNEATYTLIAVRQNLDILSIGTKKRYLHQQAKVAEAETKVTERELMREVGIDYMNAIVAHQRTKVYQNLDSVYRDFERAAKLRYETEATTKLEYINAQQQSRQAALLLNEARLDEQMALQNLNRWLGQDANYKPTYAALQSLSASEQISPNPHPNIQLAQEKVKLAELQTKTDKADYLPKFYLQGGTQKIGNKTGYWTYEVGVSMPLFSTARSAKAKAGKLQQEAEKAQQVHMQLQLSNELKRLSNNNEKWQQQLQYFREMKLPLAEEQQRVAIESYRQGAIDYMAFINNMKEVAKVHLDYWNAYGEYLNNKMNLRYY